MDLSDKNYWLIIIGMIAITVEVILGAATGFDLLLLGVIFIISGGLGIFTSSFPLALGSITVFSLLYITLGRRFIKNKLVIATRATNVDNLIGKKGVVSKAVSPHHAGQIKLEGEVWRAGSDREIEVGREVEVKSVSGVTLHVQ